MNDFVKIATFLVLAFLSYYLFFKSNKVEGLDTMDKGGVAGGADKNAADIKIKTVMLHDSLLIPKYRKQYDTTIMNWEELINNMMLETLLTADINNPLVSLERLNTLNQSIITLNNIQSYVDSVK